MSMLIHRCRRCHHPEMFRELDPATKTWDGTCCYGTCPCTGLDRDPEPELIPTFVSGGRTSTRFIRPGEDMNPGFMARITACTCQRCNEKAEEIEPT
jgi:hypothetical protein